MSSTFTKKKLTLEIASLSMLSSVSFWSGSNITVTSSAADPPLFLCPVVMSNLQPELSKIALIFAYIGTFYVLVWATRYLLAGNLAVVQSVSSNKA
jgi:hypothetical protein